LSLSANKTISCHIKIKKKHASAYVNRGGELSFHSHSNWRLQIHIRHQFTIHISMSGLKLNQKASPASNAASVATTTTALS